MTTSEALSIIEDLRDREFRHRNEKAVRALDIAIIATRERLERVLAQTTEGK